MNPIKDELFEISKLIAAELTGAITDGERKMLDNWRNENEDTYDRLSVSTHLRADYDYVREADSWKALENMRLKIEKERTRRRRKAFGIWGAAAAAAILLISTVVIQEDRNDAPHLLSSVRELPPYTMLTLADGSEVRLDNETKILTPEGMTFDIGADHGVVYANGDDAVASEAASGSNTITVPRGCEFDIVLQDGTHVWLNSESRISFPVKFGAKERRVTIEGEAYFEVAKNEQVPFIVEAGAQSITVFGTEFDVNTYDNRVVTTLVNGSVRVHADGQSVDMVPGEQSVVSDGRIVKQMVDAKEYASWKDGYFVLEGRSFLSVMNSIARWYDVDILWRAPSLYDMEFRGRIPRPDSLEHLLETLEMTKEVKFRINNGVVEIDCK